MQAVALVRVLIENSFMNTSFHTRLPCGITSGAERSRSSKRALSPLSTTCTTLTRSALERRNPPGGDAERADGREERIAFGHLSPSAKRRLWGPPGQLQQRGPSSPHIQALETELVRSGSL